MRTLLFSIIYIYKREKDSFYFSISKLRLYLLSIIYIFRIGFMKGFMKNKFEHNINIIYYLIYIYKVAVKILFN